MRLKVGFIVAMSLLLAVSSAMAASITLQDNVSGDGVVQLIAPKSTTHGVSINGTSLSTPGSTGHNPFGVGTVDIQLFNAGGTFDPTIVFTDAKEPGTFKKAQLFLGGTLITTLEASSKAGDRLAAAVPTPEPGTLFLLAGTMAVGFGFLRKRAPEVG